MIILFEQNLYAYDMYSLFLVRLLIFQNFTTLQWLLVEPVVPIQPKLIYNTLESWHCF